MIRLLLFVGMGGFAGSICRFLIHHIFSKNWPNHVPFGTLLTNVVGCFLLGMLVHSASKMDKEWVLLLTSGFCGGFTTFSTFGTENTIYLLEGQTGLAMLNISLSLVLGIGATFLGWFIGKTLFA